MREIKFRAWDTERNVMIQPKDLIHLDGETTKSLKESAPFLELEEYTGLKDKQGKDIFEGDIVSCIAAPSGRKMAQAKKMTGKIVYSGWSFTVSLWHKNEWWAYGALDLSTFEIIGNIHENPLEVTK